MLGETLARKYVVEELLGEGAMGSVYRARHQGTGRRVAIKVIAGELAKHANIVARFQVEARAAGVVDSQHIAQVLDVGTDEVRGVPYLVMELLNGEDVQKTQQRLQLFPPDLVARIGAQACMGLTKAHAARIVHRDIKPGNMFLAERDEGDRVLKLLDFGVAKMKMEDAGGEVVNLTRTGNLIGTPLYMSPEQARGDKVIDARADIWSLGVVMYQLLQGRTPHHHIDALGKLIIQICSVPATPLAEVAPWVPPGLAEIVERCLRIEADERFQSADALLAALRSLLPNGTGISAAMIAPLSEAERASRPPSPARGKSDAAIAASGATNGSARASTPDVAKSMGAVSSDAEPLAAKPQPSAGIRGTIAALALAIVAVGGFGIYRWVSAPGAVPPSNAAPQSIENARAPEPTAPATATASPEPAASTAPVVAEPTVAPAPSADAPTAASASASAAPRSAPHPVAKPRATAQSKAKSIHDPTRSM